jgi:UDP-N-acetylmuramoylalanine--D-glutamate ligase
MAPGRAHEMIALVEGFDADSVALARYLVTGGHEVRLAGQASATSSAEALSALGVSVEPLADLDRDPGAADIAFLDVWTPETAPRVGRLRAQGTRVSCLGDLLLEQWRGPTVGITGTAGKTTTTALVTSMLEAEGTGVAVSAGAASGNLWPTSDMLAALNDDSDAPQGVLVLELTSSHLCFMHRSPAIAAVVSFWPDHLELHGSLHRYRSAKATIVRHQLPDDVLVVNLDDAAATFAAAARGHVRAFSLHRPVGHGAYVRDASTLVLVDPAGVEHRCRPWNDVPTHPGNVAAAAAVAAAAGASPGAVEAGMAAGAPLAFRAHEIGTFAGVAWVDDGMAATPAKTAALLARYPDSSIVLIAGGLDDAGGGRVHAAPEEAVLLEGACDEIARAARSVILFGEGGARLGALLTRRGADLHEVDDLAAAVAFAAARAEGAAAVVFSPVFPVSLADRGSFGRLVAERR